MSKLGINAMSCMRENEKYKLKVNSKTLIKITLAILKGKAILNEKIDVSVDNNIEPGVGKVTYENGQSVEIKIKDPVKIETILEEIERY